MRYAMTAAVLASCAISSASAQTDEVRQRVDQTIQANTHPLVVDPQRGVSGPGGELLVERGGAAAFTCIAESHLNSETPAFTTALMRALRPRGYAVYCAEVGPIAGAELARRAGEGVESMRQMLLRFPFSAAFVDHLPEAECFRAMNEMGVEIWSLDQEFIGGGRFALSRLVEIAPSDEARAVAQAHFDRAMEGLRKFLQEGDQSAAFMTSTTPAQFAELRAAFEGNEEGEWIVDELASSASIYQLFGQGRNYQSNLDRIGLMKRHLADHLANADPEAKVMLRFGSTHMARAYSALNQLDLGSFCTGVGLVRGGGGGSLHLTVLSLTSEQTDGSTFDRTESSPWLDMVAPALDESEWVVVDLEPLRPIFHRERNRAGFENLNDHVWDYDVAVVTRTFMRASVMEGLPVVPR